MVERIDASLRVCQVETCDRLLTPPYGRGMCGMHYQRWRKHGDPNHERSRRKSVEPCEIEGCEKLIKARGWCANHLYRYYAHGSPTSRRPGEVVNGKKICPNCQVDKPVTEYTQRIDRYDSWCLECYANAAVERRRENPKPKVARRPAICELCGAEFMADKRRFRYCSRDCFEANRHKANWKHVVRRRARLRGLTIESFDRIEIFERDDWVCQLCGDPVDRDTVRPDPRSPSIDHIIPVSRGGAHSRENVHTAHLGCNIRKGAALEGEVA